MSHFCFCAMCIVFLRDTAVAACDRAAAAPAGDFRERQFSSILTWSAPDGLVDRAVDGYREGYALPLPCHRGRRTTRTVGATCVVALAEPLASGLPGAPATIQRAPFASEPWSKKNLVTVMPLPPCFCVC